MDPKSIPGGGPAFPTDNEQQNGPSSYHYEGMSLRDYFAAKAMQGASANANIEALFQKFGSPGQVLADWIAPAAYVMADAMLAAREAE